MLRIVEERSIQEELCIHYKLTIRSANSSIEKAFQALTDRNTIDEWGGGPSRVQAKVHGIISFWDGEMHGTIREIESPSLLVHTIRHVQWEASHIDSMVTWHLTPLTKGICIEMKHSGLPTQKLLEMQDEIWAASFLGPLKASL